MFAKTVLPVLPAPFRLLLLLSVKLPPTPPPLPTLLRDRHQRPQIPISVKGNEWGAAGDAKGTGLVDVYNMLSQGRAGCLSDGE